MIALFSHDLKTRPVLKNKFTGLIEQAALPAQLVLYDRLGLTNVTKMRVANVFFNMGAYSVVGNVVAGVFHYVMSGGHSFAIGDDNSLWVGSVAMLVAGIRENRKRLKEEREGDITNYVHSCWPGDSRLRFLPLPEMFTRVIVTPFTAFMVGACSWKLGGALLGQSLIFSSGALFLCELTVLQQAIKRQRVNLDIALDGDIDADDQRRINARRKSKSSTNSVAIATGSDDRLAYQIEARKRKQISNDSYQGEIQ